MGAARRASPRTVTESLPGWGTGVICVKAGTAGASAWDGGCWRVAWVWTQLQLRSRPGLVASPPEQREQEADDGGGTLEGREQTIHNAGVPPPPLVLGIDPHTGSSFR